MRRWCRAVVLATVGWWGSGSSWAQPLAPLDAAVRSATGGDATAGYRHAEADLNDDGVPDAVVMLAGPAWCGSGGCTMLVFAGTRQGYRLVSRSTVSDEPVHLLPSRQKGWHGLLVTDRHKGLVQMPFNGRRYPANPSLQPKASAAQLKAGRPLVFAEVAPP